MLFYLYVEFWLGYKMLVSLVNNFYFENWLLNYVFDWLKGKVIYKFIFYFCIDIFSVGYLLLLLYMIIWLYLMINIYIGKLK